MQEFAILSEEQVWVRAPDGSLWVLPKAQVRRVVFGKVDLAKLREEERLRKKRIVFVQENAILPRLPCSSSISLSIELGNMSFLIW